jgi:hypothetical protein
MKSILLLNRSDFNNYYGQELLAHLEGIKSININGTINFATNTRFQGDASIRVMEAFNMYLGFLSQTVSRIIINLK